MVPDLIRVESRIRILDIDLKVNSEPPGDNSSRRIYVRESAPNFHPWIEKMLQQKNLEPRVGSLIFILPMVGWTALSTEPHRR